jgi:dolichol kinase
MSSHFGWPSDAQVLVAATVAFALIFVVAEFSHAHGVSAESTRRFAHASGSAVAAVIQVTLSLPELFVLAFGFGALLVATRVLRWLPSIHRVSRQTAGAALLPVGLLAAAFAGGEHHAATAFGMLVLAFADPLAAVAGTPKGPSWQILGGRKSVRGSAAFFATALCLAAIFTITSGHSQPIAAVGVAMILTAAEACSGFGLDNLVVPAMGTLAGRTWLGL